ncbi:hypothetical protein CO168_00535 [Candidatus Shapirobacteria bacterium CG_4_9_14_3_um_filter_36_12]|uniref:Big-1 domain-containing protein n=3 Tax=Candidatus Shapironibacteriota TaxID=1752721 RepID=A0A2M7XNY0_9BACT|nr:MAG: hypothetical protein COS53_01405 [Candidatus Shapirobacteria bacterium CG03_land_8_20_14_0_80_35_14]PIX68321.1 MAG: hypothetical protein COZ41_00195 [Candidatus Shapirobacteria bacterium CG_4_10_14_3_um_filter_35_13]PJA51285.1 MAG: hypothetical protein CO168_00535 [Candidatus Shapirobacteria bacterium CG_4_9_14_3_um_filter_36_12]
MSKNIKNTQLLIIIILLCGLVIGLVVSSRSVIFQGKASSTNNNSVSVQNSYLFASPLAAKADGQEKIRLTIFLLDSRGLGISHQKVTINAPSSLQLINTQPTTDDTGKAIFDSSSTVATTYQISASTSNQVLPQKVKITFN